MRPEDERCRRAHPVSWNWWRLLLGLHKGVAFVAVYGDDLVRAETGPEYEVAFDWVTTYAGWLDHPRASPGAWIALRGGDAGGDPQLRDPEVSHSMT